MFMFLDITVCCGLFAILLLRYSDFFYIVFFFFLPPHLLSLLFLCVLFSFFFFFFFHPWYTIASWFMIVFLIPPLLCDSIPSGVLLKHEDGVCLKVRKWDTQFHNFLWKAKKKLSEISTDFLLLSETFLLSDVCLCCFRFGRVQLLRVSVSAQMCERSRLFLLHLSAWILCLWGRQELWR